jgi:putative ABC transport system permease protein
MIINYIKVAFRNILRHKGYSSINIIGLSAGMAVCLLLFLWVHDELSYDRYHENVDQIYRIIFQYESEGKVKGSASTPAPLGPALVSEFPEVKKAVRFGENGFLVCCKDKCFFERIFFADPEVFEVFNFPLVQGNPAAVLNTPYSIIISENIRDKYFGKEDPVGKIINLKGKHDFKITGVFKKIPRNSHFTFDFLGGFSDYAGRNSDKWGISNYYTYVLISKDYPLYKFEAKLPSFIEKYRGKEAVSVYKTKYLPQPLTRIHLHSHLRNEIEPNSDIRNIYIFSAIALFILLIACFNYINLSTAMYIKRIKEIGVRKVIGAVRSQLINQFLCEAFLFSLITLPLGLLCAQLFLPFFNAISGKQLMIRLFDNSFLLPGIVIIFLAVGFFSGFFPALFVSYMKPINALKGMFKFSSKISLLRKFLVVFQFTISVAFIINSIVILNQLNYIRNKDLGFNKECIVNIPIHRKAALEQYETIKNEFLKNSNVTAVSASSFFPGKNRWYVNYWREGINPDENPMINCLIVDDGFLETFNIKLLKGRSFSKHFPGDRGNTYILNNLAVKEFGWESPIGKEFKLGSAKKGTVIGVVEDFHFRSLHHDIKPVALYFSPQWFAYFSVKIASHDIPQSLSFLKNKWQGLVPNQFFEYSFLDEDIDNLYKTEARLGNIFIAVAFLAIFVACLGLFGLAAFTSEQRTKEIGIRKVLGASAARIVLLMSKEFTRWVLVANIIAWPVAWYAMNKWLQNFAYRTSIGIWIFLLAGLIVFIIALLTLSYKAISAALANPIKALRYE